MPVRAREKRPPRSRSRKRGRTPHRTCRRGCCRRRTAAHDTAGGPPKTTLLSSRRMASRMPLKEARLCRRRAAPSWPVGAAWPCNTAAASRRPRSHRAARTLAGRIRPITFGGTISCFIQCRPAGGFLAAGIDRLARRVRAWRRADAGALRPRHRRGAAGTAA